MTLLDFEQPLGTLKEQLQKAKAQYSNSEEGKELISNLEKDIQKLEKQLYSDLSRWQKVQISRHTERPYTLDYLEHSFSEFIELHGDRCSGNDRAVVGGFAMLGSRKVVVIGQQKGRNTKQRQMRNFGMANPEGYRKASRLMSLAEKFGLPVVTLIDTPGAYPGLHAEEYGQGEAIARNLKQMALLKVPIVSVVIGEGASGGALGIGMGNKVLMMQYTWYSVISPESCSSILWRTWDHKEEAAEVLRLTAEDMLEQRLIDAIIPEPARRRS